MELTNRQLLNAFQSLQILAREPLYVSASLRVRKTLVRLREEASLLEELKSDLIDLYGQTTEDGRVEIDDEDSFLDEWNSAMDETTSVDIEPIPVSSLDKNDSVQVAPAVLDVLLDAGVLVD